MSNFDLVARVFGIVLALAMSELLKGFARLWRLHYRVEDADRPPVHIGWLVPLLGVLMLLDQVTFWFNFTLIGPHVPSTLVGLAGFMGVIGTYFALSTFIFPPDAKVWPDFDVYYFKVRRIVIGGLLGVNIVSAAYQVGLAISLGDFGPEDGAAGPVGHAMILATFGLLIALLFVRGRRLSLVLLLGAIIATLGNDLPF